MKDWFSGFLCGELFEALLHVSIAMLKSHRIGPKTPANLKND